jgi:Domain of unknown function (DUF929)
MGRETNAKRRAAQAATAREKASQARAEAQRTEQRRRALAIIGSVVAVAVVIAVVAVIALNHKGSSSGSGSEAATPANPAVVSKLTSVSPQTLSTIGSGSSGVLVTPTSGAPLTTDGKPTFMYVGGEFCPFCAAERWSMVQALSKFGTLSGLKQIHSSEDNIATFDFKDATFSSKYLAFAPREIQDQNHKPLQTLSPAEQAIYQQSSQSFPFLYFNGKYSQDGAGYNPLVLSGLTHEQIADKAGDPTSDVGKGVSGEGNVLTAAICGMTGNKPANVCDNPTISGLLTKINANH